MKWIKNNLSKTHNSNTKKGALLNIFYSKSRRNFRIFTSISKKHILCLTNTSYFKLQMKKGKTNE